MGKYCYTYSNRLLRHNYLFKRQVVVFFMAWRASGVGDTRGRRCGVVPNPQIKQGRYSGKRSRYGGKVKYKTWVVKCQIAYQSQESFFNQSRFNLKGFKITWQISSIIIEWLGTSSDYIGLRMMNHTIWKFSNIFRIELEWLMWVPMNSDF